MMLTQRLRSGRCSLYFTLSFSRDKLPSSLTLRTGKDFRGPPNSCPSLLQCSYPTAFNSTWIPPTTGSSPFHRQTCLLLGSSANWKILFPIELKPAVLVFWVKSNLKAHQLLCTHSPDEESEAREDEAMVPSIGHIPTPRSKNEQVYSLLYLRTMKTSESSSGCPP